jgi:hypothetical protein
MPVIPVVHATHVDAARNICKTGFATLATVDAGTVIILPLLKSLGWYGQGIYFTTFAEYSATYALNSPLCSFLSYITGSVDPCILLCYLVPGNPYPVTEGPFDSKTLKGTVRVTPLIKLPGAPLKPGYQSHYILVDGSGVPDPENGFDEIVVNQDTQANICL